MACRIKNSGSAIYLIYSMFHKENHRNLQLFDGCQILFGRQDSLNNQITGPVYLADLYFGEYF